MARIGAPGRIRTCDPRLRRPVVSNPGPTPRLRINVILGVSGASKGGLYEFRLFIVRIDAAESKPASPRGGHRRTRPSGAAMPACPRETRTPESPGTSRGRPGTLARAQTEPPPSVRPDNRCHRPRSASRPQVRQRWRPRGPTIATRASRDRGAGDGVRRVAAPYRRLPAPRACRLAGRRRIARGRPRSPRLSFAPAHSASLSGPPEPRWGDGPRPPGAVPLMHAIEGDGSAATRAGDGRLTTRLRERSAPLLVAGEPSPGRPTDIVNTRLR